MGIRLWYQTFWRIWRINILMKIFLSRKGRLWSSRECRLINNRWKWHKIWWEIIQRWLRISWQMTLGLEICLLRHSKCLIIQRWWIVCLTWWKIKTLWTILCNNKVWCDKICRSRMFICKMYNRMYHNQTCNNKIFLYRICNNRICSNYHKKWYLKI